jgi:membrane peptidoglycan carboxypeptidase
MGLYLPAAVLAAEDQRFRQHAGFDEAEVAALLAHVADGRPARGASTITQQLARTLVTGHERTAARKLRELLYAIEMERTLGKERILELYLNTVDWGPGICGAKAAARTYFRKSPAKLTPIEAAWLAGILRNPHAAWQHEFVARAPERERAAWVLMQMRELPRQDRQRFASQPIRFAPAPAPSASPPLMAGVSRAAESAR